MKRTYTQTELAMSYGVLAGAVVGTPLFVITGSPFWFAVLPLGVVAGLAVGQVRDRSGRTGRRSRWTSCPRTVAREGAR